MAGQEDKDKTKSLEMRIAELEDKLAKLHITEEEMRAYEKVSSLLGGLGEGVSPALSPQLCSIPRARMVCVMNCGGGPRWRPIVRFCYECTCGPCACGDAGGFMGGGGFGGFGM